MTLKTKRCGDMTFFSMEALGDTPSTPAIPLPVTDMSALKANTLYSFEGMDIFVEYVKGDTRSGRAADGTPWSNTVPTAYGYFANTVDADGEDVDVFLNQVSFDPNAPVFVMDQNDPGSGRFDEHKAFMGYSTEAAAFADYEKMVPQATTRRAAVVSMPVGTFRDWVKSEATKVPVSAPAKATEASAINRVASRTVVKIPTTDRAPKIVVRKGEAGLEIEMYILSEFDLTEWSSMPETMIDLIESASENDSILIGIASYGGVLDLAARIASAIRICRAKVTTISLGPVASAGCLVWCEGHIREIAAGSYFMQHEAGCTLRGKTSQIAKTATVTSEYVKSIIFPRAISVGLFKESEIDAMVDKGCDIYVSAREAARRTGAEIVVK